MNAKPLWAPSPERAAQTAMARFMAEAAQRAGRPIGDYAALHGWSIERSADFWTLVWEFCGVRGALGRERLVEGERMPGARWFGDSRLNFAENLLREADDSDALVFWGEDRVKRRLSRRALHELVARLAQALAAAGVKKGDRVAGYLPNLPEAVAAMLASASLGAIWSSCSPDFGVQGVLDRFGQIGPKVLFCADGYLYGGKQFDSLDKVREILAKLPSVERCIVVPYGGERASAAGVRGGVALADFIAPNAPGLGFERVEFNHPLYILYSSGTTGVPKCIVHGAGGTLLQHLKEHVLHSDVRPGDRLFYFTTLGWMMWNWLASGLAAGATLLLYDGSPFANRGRVLFDFADAEGMTHFGTSAKFVDAIAKIGLEPKKTHRLEKLRALLSTGSPLVPEAFDYVYAAVKEDLCLSSISGGTDIVSCFVLGNPMLPVWRGEIQCKGLGMAVEVYDEGGRALQGEKGELVCTRPFPSMPLGFWNDADGAKYRAAYFDKYPNVWRHGDWCEVTAHGGLVIYGRSDAVLNPGGVRIGTAEIYRQVEQLDEVVESIVIGQDWPPERPSDVRVVLFVRLKDGLVLDERLVARIKQRIRDNTTPRHVPAKVLQVGDIPRTKSGKIVELAVRNVVHGQPVKNVEALANPEALEQFRARAELRTE
ncbi:MAG: acetoacetate--CoA ligase [Betaproteobacteria bacterium]|nr:acetoacetate--CoA ligase [Betaproteobacteria bacterium]